jgi:hypothetical protein
MCPQPEFFTYELEARIRLWRFCTLVVTVLLIHDGFNLVVKILDVLVQLRIAVPLP